MAGQSRASSVGQGSWPLLIRGCPIRLALSSPLLSGSSHHLPQGPVPQDRQQQRLGLCGHAEQRPRPPPQLRTGPHGEGLTPTPLMGPLGRLATFASWRLKPAASADLPGPAGSLLWGLGRWGGQPPGAGMGSWSGCPRRAWLRLLSPDRGILAGGWRGLQPKPGPEEPQEAGGLVPDLAGGGADREGCV